MNLEYAVIVAVLILFSIVGLGCLTIIPDAIMPLADPSAVPVPSRAVAKTAPQPELVDQDTRHGAPWILRLMGVIVMVGAVVGFVAIQVARHRRAVETVSEEEGPPPLAAAEQQAIPSSPHAEKRLQILRRISGRSEKLKLGELGVSQFMSGSVINVKPDTSREELEELLWEKHLRHVLVIEDEELVGVISDRDLLGRSGRTAGEIMSTGLITIDTDTPASTVVSLMLQHRISSLPIVEDDKVLGVVTTTDALIALQCVLRLIQQDLDEERQAEQLAAVYESDD